MDEQNEVEMVVTDGRTTHGAKSEAVRRRYSDERTQEGKRLRAVRDGLVESVGGLEGMTAPQGLLLAAMEAKLIILWQISDYVDKNSVVDGVGELLPCLNNGFVKYSDSLRRDLVTFYGLSRYQIRRERLPKLEDLIRANVEGEE
jgi:hypothetical protein